MASAAEPLPHDAQVLIVGAGPTGLSAALCLAEAGVDAVLIEARLSPHSAPSAHVINRRTLEIFRAVGAHDRMMAAEGAGFPEEGLQFVRRVADGVLGEWNTPQAVEALRMAEAAQPAGLPTKKVPQERQSPAGAQLNLSQPQLEAVLGDVLRQRYPPRAHVRYGCSLESFEQEDGFVRATVVCGGDAAKRCQIRCRYMIACDGARSGVRERLGVQLETTVPQINPAAYDPKGGIIQHHSWIYFTADLRKHFRSSYGPALYWYHADTISGLLINYNGGTEWVMHAPLFPEEEAHPADWTEAECARRVTEALGESPADLRIRAKGAWQMTCNVATSFQVGRVFLAGDACHRFPPSGGHGQNTGVQDVHNLAWKLAAVLRGWASPALLESYEEERFPVARYNADQSARNNKQMAEIEAALGMQPASPWKSLAEYRRSLECLKTAKTNSKALAKAIQRSTPHWMSEGQQLGFTYEEGALVPDGTPLVQELQNPRADEISDGTAVRYEPTSRPGSRLPHVWVTLLDGAGLLRHGPGLEALPEAPHGPPAHARASCASLHDCVAWDAVTLLTVDEGPHARWSDVVAEVRRSCAVPVRHVHLAARGEFAEADIVVEAAQQPDGETPAREVLELCGASACLLVRPDEMVGFRAGSAVELGGPQAAASVLVAALERIARTAADGQGLPALPNPRRRGGDWPAPKLKGRFLCTKNVIPPIRFAHCVLRTRDIDASIRWYSRVLGASVVQRSEFLAFLTYDEEHHRIALVSTPQAPSAPSGAPGLDHLAYTHADLGSLLQTYARLKQEGIVPFWCVNHGPTTSMYYRDLDGNGVELQVDNFPTEAELKGWMTSDHFNNDQIGVEFDPDLLLQRYLRGDPLDILKKQGAAGSSARPKF